MASIRIVVIGVTHLRRLRLRLRPWQNGLPMPSRLQVCLIGTLVSSLSLWGCGSCRRQPQVSAETYRDAVTAFHTGLAALQTSQDVLARQEFERVTTLVPHEPAGWANLGLLLLRHQDIDGAEPRLRRASELAPDNAAIERLLALMASVRGNLPEAIRHWRRALELDPGDLRAPYALAQELERQEDEAGQAEAQRILADLVARSDNLAARLEYARLAARRGDAEALQQALAPLAQRSAAWTEEARARLDAVRQAAARGPSEAATPIVFLKNVLIREPQYRLATAAVTTPRAEVGEPLARFVVLENPAPQPAPADTALTFAVEPAPGIPQTGTAWSRFVHLNGEAPPTLVAADGRAVHIGGGARVPFPGGPGGIPPSPAGIVPADLDYDFRVDLALAGAGGLTILGQAEDGTFVDVTGAAGIPEEVRRAALHGVWAADIDTDGDLDLLVAPVTGDALVLRNNGDGTFATVSPFPGVAGVRDFVWADLDGEGVPDAVLLDDRGSTHLFQNLRGGEFQAQPVPDSFPQVAAVAAADATGDGLFDVLGATAGGEIARMSHRAGRWEASALARFPAMSGLAPGAATLRVADLDNNGAGDLIVGAAAETRVLLGTPEGPFHALAGSLPFGVTSAADLDGDGRLELAGSGSGAARLARSRGERAYHWQVLRPRAATITGDQRVNSFGIGGEVEIRTGLHAQKALIASPVVHFGLGEATRAEVARLTWPNGFVQSEFDLQADLAIAASQRLKGSCPWLFTWNGREMTFVTDFIWRSPLGLRINAQETADVLMTEDRVKIRGDQLAPRDGVYDLRVTTELWETQFFDLVSLLVVDHPENTEVWIDERFAVPAPSFAVVTTDPIEEFQSVRDDTGRDVSGIVRARDDRHLDFAGRGAYQGITRPHYIEMDLPADAPRRGPLWLIGQGWVHPTDSSINVAMGQGAHAAPQGLSLHVADAAGRFREVRANLGFPSGKDKTVLIDLTGVFAPDGPRRLRLATNLEIFWDRLGWAAGRPDVRLQPRRTPLGSAELRYRGFSATDQKDLGTPERPRYVLEGTAPRWRDLEGYHTRFGDVRELLHEVDDRYVIMNAGDEMLLRFAAVPPPRPGMVRDFVLIGDGWVKDGDYNTTASRTVLPLPAHDSPRYDARPGRLEDDPVYVRHREDFERYHTRYVSPDAFRDALRRSRDGNR